MSAISAPVCSRLLTSLAITSFALGFAAAEGARAQSLVVNGEFDLDVSTWELVGSPGSELVWNTLDHDSCGDASGSAEFVNDAATPDTGNYIMSCVPGITPGAAYSFEAFLRFPDGQAATGSASTLLQWYDSALDCDGSFVANSPGGTPSVTTATPAVWLRSGADAVVAPAGAHSARARVTLFKATAGEPLMVRIDGFHVVEGGGILLFDGFESGSTCRWTSAVPN